MKKRYLAAGLIGSFFAGAVVYNRIKEKKSDNVLMYPVCRVTMHNENHVFTVDDLIKKSELIISGYVDSVSEPRWNNDENKQPNSINEDDVIYKDYKIIVQHIIKGINYSIGEVKLRSYEGTINGFTIEDNSQFILNPLDKVTLFLTKDNSLFNKKNYNNYFIPIDGNQGVFLHSDQKIGNIYHTFNTDEFNSLMEFVY